METSQSLEIESFSYSWLANLKPSFESQELFFRSSLDSYDESSFIEMDPKLSSSKRFVRVSHDFHFPISQAPVTLADADELISNGLLMPLFVKQLEKEANNASDSTKTSPSPSRSPEKLHLSNRTHYLLLKKCGKLTKKLVLKYLDFLKPLCKRVRGRRLGSRVGTFSARLHGEKNWDCSTSTSPRASIAYSADYYRRSCDSDSSIYEAVLHCKRTIGQ